MRGRNSVNEAAMSKKTYTMASNRRLAARRESSRCRVTGAAYTPPLRMDYKQLKRRCNESWSMPNRYVFIDNGSHILGVAHTDTVQSGEAFGVARTGVDNYIFSPRLDDRLGVYTLLDYLPALGVNLDVLLTDDEEMCKSTARYFIPAKPYNWMVSFDREGTDVVTYGIDSDEWLMALFELGFEIGMGSYSDICELEHLGCCGMNIGTGLVSGHSERAFTSQRDYEEAIGRFLVFYEKYRDMHFPYDPCDLFADWRDAEDRWFEHNSDVSFFEWREDLVEVCDEYNDLWR